MGLQGHLEPQQGKLSESGGYVARCLGLVFPQFTIVVPINRDVTSFINPISAYARGPIMIEARCCPISE